MLTVGMLEDFDTSSPSLGCPEYALQTMNIYLVSKERNTLLGSMIQTYVLGVYGLLLKVLCHFN